MDKEDDVSLTVSPQLKEWIHKHSRVVGYLSVITFMLLLLFVGFAFGAAYICEGQVAGFLDDRFNCHLNLTSNNEQPLKPDTTIIQNEIESYGINI